MKKNRRPQNAKKTPREIQRVLDLRRGSRTSRIPSGKTYNRKAKHGKVWE